MDRQDLQHVQRSPVATSLRRWLTMRYIRSCVRLMIGLCTASGSSMGGGMSSLASTVESLGSTGTIRADDDEEDGGMRDRPTSPVGVDGPTVDTSACRTRCCG